MRNVNKKLDVQLQMYNVFENFWTIEKVFALEHSVFETTRRTVEYEIQK